MGDPRIIITLRDPAAHAFSCYLHLKRQGRETLSFEGGLAAEQQRMEKGWHYHWHYLHSGFYANQVAAYLENFSRVKVCFLEDMHSDARTFVRDIFRFLEVDETFEPPCVDALQRGWRSPLEAALQPGPQGVTGPGRKRCNWPVACLGRSDCFDGVKPCAQDCWCANPFEPRRGPN